MITAEILTCTQITRPENFGDSFGNLINTLECRLPQSGFGPDFWVQLITAVATLATVLVAAGQVRAARNSADESRKYIEDADARESRKNASLVSAWCDPMAHSTVGGQIFMSRPAQVNVENNSPTPIYNVVVESPATGKARFEIPILMPNETKSMSVVDWHPKTVDEVPKEKVPLPVEFEDSEGKTFRRDERRGWRISEVKPTDNSANQSSVIHRCLKRFTHRFEPSQKDE